MRGKQIVETTSSYFKQFSQQKADFEQITMVSLLRQDSTTSYNLSCFFYIQNCKKRNEMKWKIVE